WDEVAHIGAGVSYIQRLDLRLNEEHPPLAKVIAAIPLVLRGTYADYAHISWTSSEKFLGRGAGGVVIRGMAAGSLERSCAYAGLGSAAHVACYAIPRLDDFCRCTEAGRRLGRPPFPLGLREHAGVHCVRPARAYRHRRNVVLPAYPVAI